MLTSKENKVIGDIESKYYMQPILNAIKHEIECKKISIRDAFDNIYGYLRNSESEVRAIVQERVKTGEIQDEKQALKSIAGNAFSKTIVWIFLQCKKTGLISENIFITSKQKEVPNYESLFLIKVGEETQKPDVDLVIYSLTSVDKMGKCMVLSLKTSLRERAGQTYKWKLLMEIAEGNSIIKEKYNIAYNPPTLPFVFFATVNFYNEINNPQHRGMFKFFDGAFIGKNVQTANFIRPLSEIIDFVNQKLV